MKEYDKLVRDKIPEIIEADGKECEVEVMDDEEYKEYLKDKLLEEAEEYVESGEIEELADVLEVIKSIAENEEIEFDKIEEMRKEKAVDRGRFEKKIKFLKVY
jgi:predicted house-cleaning noncanonical NTP pyrophosphatase (MazG superfamily)